MNSFAPKSSKGDGEDSPTAPLLVMDGIGKRFGATIALRDVTLEAYRGHVVAVIGENGAGKSTLMKVLSGAHVPDQGMMMIEGHPFRPQGPIDARRSGIAMIYQELNLARDLSVEDNIMLGMESQTFGFLDRKSQREKVRRALELLGHAHLDPMRMVGNLSIGLQQLVEIARALVSDARVIIFDEPTSSLPAQDVSRLFDVIRRLKQKGIAILYISHFLEEIREIAERYVVLRDGKTAGRGWIRDVSDRQIVSLMVGRSVEELFPQVAHQQGEELLRVEELTGNSLPKRVQLNVHRGEIFGLFGLVGAGRTETLRHLLGLDAAKKSQMWLDRKPIAGITPQRIKMGMGLVSEDRKGEGLSQSLSINENLTMSHLRPYANWGWLSLKRRRQVVEQWMERISIKAQDPDQPIHQLSGGNQQKVALARILHQDATLLLLDEPTKGIDVGTKSEIYHWIGSLANEGKGILWVSSYLPELLAVCDTIGVMSRGILRDVRPAKEWTEDEILSLAISGEGADEDGE